MGLFKTDEERAAADDEKQRQWDSQYVTSPAAGPVPTWEYKTFFFGAGTKISEAERALNILGAQGWELVTMDVERNQRVMGSPAQMTVVVKRMASPAVGS